MLTGIGTLGMLTGTIATFFLRNKGETTYEAVEELDTAGLDPQQRIHVQRYIDFLRNSE